MARASTIEPEPDVSISVAANAPGFAETMTVRQNIELACTVRGRAIDDTLTRAIESSLAGVSMSELCERPLSQACGHLGPDRWVIQQPCDGRIDGVETGHDSGYVAEVVVGSVVSGRIRGSDQDVSTVADRAVARTLDVRPIRRCRRPASAQSKAGRHAIQ